MSNEKPLDVSKEQLANLQRVLGRKVTEHEFSHLISIAPDPNAFLSEPINLDSSQRIKWQHFFASIMALQEKIYYKNLNSKFTPLERQQFEEALQKTSEINKYGEAKVLNQVRKNGIKFFRNEVETKLKEFEASINRTLSKDEITKLHKYFSSRLMRSSFLDIPV